MLFLISTVLAFFSGSVQEGVSDFVQMTFIFAIIILFVRFVFNGGLDRIDESCTGILCGGMILLAIIGAAGGGGGGGPRLQYVMGRGLETVYDIGFRRDK